MPLNGYVQLVSRTLHHRFAHRALILLYHRVLDLPADPQLLCVSPQHFAEHLEVIRQYTQPISLKTLVEDLAEGRLPRRAVVVTFDDGYADNLTHAKPLLERYDIPASIFVTTGHIDCAEEFWWDELERLILTPGTFPEGRSPGRSELADLIDFIDVDTFSKRDYQCHLDWHIERPDDPTPRHRLYRTLYQHLHPQTDWKRQEILGELRNWAGKDSTGRPTHRTLTSDEVIDLARGGLIEVGAHTITHPSLTELSPAAQRQEITGSKNHLEEILGGPVASFAYPNGSYSEGTLAILREASFHYACSSDTDAVWNSADIYRLPRGAVRNWDRNEFTRWIRSWMGD